MCTQHRASDLKSARPLASRGPTGGRGRACSLLCRGAREQTPRGENAHRRTARAPCGADTTANSGLSGSRGVETAVRADAVAARRARHPAPRARVDRRPLPRERRDNLVNYHWYGIASRKAVGIPITGFIKSGFRHSLTETHEVTTGPQAARPGPTRARAARPSAVRRLRGDHAAVLRVYDTAV